jgi:hypothetical protein
MGSSQGLHVEQFAVGCLLAMKGLAIPGSHPTILNPDVHLRLPLGNPGAGAEEHPKTTDCPEQSTAAFTSSDDHLIPLVLG